MARALIASQRIQSDLAGLTGTAHDPPTAAGPSITEALSSLLHGESGSLHYLWDSVPVPVGDPLPAVDPVAPHGGTGHADVGGRFLGRGVPHVQFTPPPQPRAAAESLPAAASELDGMYA